MFCFETEMYMKWFNSQHASEIESSESQVLRSRSASNLGDYRPGGKSQIYTSTQSREYSAYLNPIDHGGTWESLADPPSPSDFNRGSSVTNFCWITPKEIQTNMIS